MKQTIEITAKTTEAVKGFDQVKAKAASTGNNVKQMGEKVGKAGSAFSALGMAAGQHLGHAGQVISALTAGPVTMLAAAFGAALAAGLKMWDKLTLSAEEYAKKVEGIATRASAAYGKVTDDQKTDKSLFDRLKKADTSTFDGLAEAAVLIELLQKKYGNLGLSIDSATKKVQGLDMAEQALRQKQTAARTDALSQKYGTAMTVLQNDFASAEKTSRGMDFGAAKKSMAALFQGAGGNLDVLENFAKQALGNAKTEDSISAWSKILDKMQAMRDTQKELRRLRETGYGSDAEEAAALQEKSEAAHAAAEAERKRQDSIEKTISGMEKELKYRQMILQGKEREAAIEKALDNARANGNLSEEQAARVAEAAGALYDANTPAAHAAAAKTFAAPRGEVSVFSAGLQNIGARGGVIRASEDAIVSATRDNGKTLAEIRDELRNKKGAYFV